MAASGWTHPRHWVPATVGTFVQILALVFVLLGIGLVPLFVNEQNGSKEEYKLIEMGVKCEDVYCYHKDSQPASDALPKERREHVHLVIDKQDPEWLSTARLLIIVGTGTNAVSLVLLFLFWSCVICCKKVVNIILHLSRVVDFLGAPTKFVGIFFILWHISAINASYAWWRYRGILEMKTLPLGLVLFSYILQTLCFVCSTLATDRGARDGETHAERLERIVRFEGLGEDEKYRRVSYHPLNEKRSSRVLAEVASHFAKDESNV